jgi:hypothetical protein
LCNFAFNLLFLTKLFQAKDSLNVNSSLLKITQIDSSDIIVTAAISADKKIMKRRAVEKKRENSKRGKKDESKIERINKLNYHILSFI